MNRLPYRHLPIFLTLLVCTFLQITRVFAAEISVGCAIESSSVAVGESFRYQIQINGTTEADVPTFPTLSGCQASFLGSSPKKQTSVSIINGTKRVDETRELYMTWQLTPTQTGTLTIPSLKVTIDGKTYVTPAQTIKVSKGETTDALELDLTLSEDAAYVGQPLTLTCSWKIALNVDSISFSIPILNDERVEVIETDLTQYVSNHRALLELPINGSKMQMYQRTIRWKGQDAIEVRKTWTLIPKTAGSLKFDPARVASKAMVGYKRSNRRDRSGFPGGIDDFFGRQKVYKTYVNSAAPLQLRVKPLPQKKRPADFTGLVGRYSLDATATPTDVRVGDPITLTIRVTGPAYLENVYLPPLTHIKAMDENFRIPTERAPAEMDGLTKIFTQTIRATRADVKEIPPIRLPYFDPQTGAYQVATSRAIPLSVTAARVVTAQDIETTGTLTSMQNRLENWQQGIAYNYESPDCMVDQRADLRHLLRNPPWFLLLAGGPIVYVLTSLITWWRRRQSDPASRRVRRAYANWKDASQAIASAPSADAPQLLLDALRAYLGDRLQLPAGALTEADARDILTRHSIPEELTSEFCALLRECEASRYAGGAGDGADAHRQLDRARTTIDALERSLP